MPRRFLTRSTGLALALVAVLAPAGFAAHLLLRDGSVLAKTAKKPATPIIKITGNVVRPLTPGTEQRLNLRLSNRSRRRQLVTGITIELRVDAAHRRAGCSRARSFRVTRIKRRTYPIAVPARRKRSLRTLGVRRVPRLRMLNLPTNQDACKGARLRLRYHARLGRTRARQAR